MLNSGLAQDPQKGSQHPILQDYRHFRDGEWQSFTHLQRSPAASTETSINQKTIRLISWNIDMSIGFARERMAAALQYLDHLVTSTPPDTPIVIFFQEMTRSDLFQIRDSSWIRQRFNITDFDVKFWRGSHYGTTILVDRRLIIQGVFRVHWDSGMDRDGLFVDLEISNSQYPDIDARTLRLCNTHLESLVAEPPRRPLQVAAAAQYLNGVVYVPCALMAGDMNSIQPFDRTLHQVNDMNDTYLELDGEEDTEEGYTWGPQAKQWSREQFGSSRMDKIFFSGNLQPKAFERIGMGVKIAEDILEAAEKEVEGGFVTDHYGVMGDFELTDGWRLGG